LNERVHNHLAFAGLFSSAVTSQAVLSAANFAVGLVLIRYTTDVQYGYYVLALNALLLLVSLQNAVFNPPLSIRINRLDSTERRGEFIGQLQGEQRRIGRAAAALCVLLGLVLWAAHVLDSITGPLVLATAAAALATLDREFFRMVLLALRRPQNVLRTDLLYVVCLVAGVVVAAQTSSPEAVAILTLGLAALSSRILLARTLRRDLPTSSATRPGMLREIAPLVAWTTAGAAIQWLFSQGYIYLVAGTLDVVAVAALAATRLLLMPVNLLSTGIGSLMLPLASGWLDRHGVALVRRRMWLFGAGVAVATLAYFAPLWFARDWIFATVFKKDFAHRDTLLLLWAAVFLVMVIRAQLGYLLAAQARFRALTLLTLASSVAALAIGYAAMLRFGVTGALMGMLIGEAITAVGIVTLSLRKEVPAVGATLRA